MSNELIASLQNPQVYTHTTQEFHVYETHISWVVLTGEYAYKIKKPVNFGFLDFSSLEQRRYFCEQEVKLNQRLAPDLYLEVVPISGTCAQPLLGDTRQVFEYAIKMRQFDPKLVLNEVQARGELEIHHMQDLATKLADFHQKIARADASFTLGTPAQVWAPMLQNFQQIEPLLSDAQDKQQMQQLAAWAQETYQRLQPLLTERLAQGFVRECHGDVHLANVTLIDDEVKIFDCIEFNDEFRWIDVISEIAFIIMDLEDRGLDAYAHSFLNAYLEITGDYAGLALLDFYKAYRAMVRAKINLFCVADPQASDTQKAAALANYRSYAQLAESYTQLKSPYLLLTLGVAGSGKSTLSAYVLQQLGGIRLRSDVERKRLFGLAADAKSHSELAAGIYTQEATEKTYAHLAQTAQALLQAGYSVTLDATHLRRWQRDAMRQVAENLGLPALVIVLQAPLDILEARIRKRALRKGEASEATLEVLHQQLAQLEPLTPEEEIYALHVDTEAPKANQQLVACLQQRLSS